MLQRELSQVLDAGEAEQILLHVLGRALNDRAYLIVHGQSICSDKTIFLAENFLRQRQNHVPLAYLLGHCEFYGLALQVNRHCLIPRPETELLIDTALELIENSQSTCLDLGTGSGAIALALKDQLPNIRAFGADNSLQALQIARANSSALGLSVDFVQSHWGQCFKPQSFNIILANPPYIAFDELQYMNQATSFEPSRALFAPNKGLAAYIEIIAQAQHLLRPQAWLVVEHGFDQAQAVQLLFAQHDFKHIKTLKDIHQQDRVTLGCWIGI